MITFDEFNRTDIRIGTILSAEKIAGTDKLMKLEVDIGSEKRTLAAGIADRYTPEDLQGKQIPILVNLEPKTIKGVESQGMILVAEFGNDYVLLKPERDVPPGTKVR